MRLQDDVLYLMSLVLHKHFERMSREFLRCRLGRSEWRCLAVLAEWDGCIVNELAELTQQPQTTISRVIARMERDGLVSRRPRKEDARFIEIQITPRGLAKLEQVWPTVQRQHEIALHGLSAKQQDMMRAQLQAMLLNLSGEPHAIERPARRRRDGSGRRRPATTRS